MENFVAYNPVILHFGENVINDLGNTVSSYGKNVLLIYGKGSIKTNGVYDQVVKQLRTAGCNIFEFSGIKPNPLVEDVNRAIAFSRENKIEVIVAAGGADR